MKSNRTIDEVKLDLQSLAKEMEPFEKKRRKLDRELYKLQMKEMEKHIGKCFRSINNYSCPKTDADYWYVYSKIIGVEDGHFKTIEFQNTCRNEFFVEERFLCMEFRNLGNIEDISQNEYEQARCGFINKFISKIYEE